MNPADYKICWNYYTLLEISNYIPTETCSRDALIDIDDLQMFKGT